MCYLTCFPLFATTSTRVPLLTYNMVKWCLHYSHILIVVTNEVLVNVCATL